MLDGVEMGFAIGCRKLSVFKEARCAGMIEFGNIAPYALPSGLVIDLPTKSNDYGFPVESVGFPVDVELDPATPVEEVARAFDAFV